jgi:small subunit ribosomal protein S6
MFLFDTTAARDRAGVEQEVDRLCDRIGAQLLVCVKFDERKLAYEIRRRKRGTYALAYFDAPPDRIGELERDARLSELILRLLVVRAENSPRHLELRVALSRSSR